MASNPRAPRAATPTTMTSAAEERLAAFFANRRDIAFAALFGSTAVGRQTAANDAVGLYTRLADATQRWIDETETPS